MIITEQKDFSDILKMLERQKRVFIVGCAQCATLCKTGGEPEVLHMKQRLEDAGLEVTGWVVLDPACHVLGDKRAFRKQREEIEIADSILVLACGNGVQAVGEALNRAAIPGIDTLFLGDIVRANEFQQRCTMCGECILDKTGGVCPVARCGKHLLNGPCGGSQDGKCETNPDEPCIWEIIVERLKADGNLEALEEVTPPKDWSKATDSGPKRLVIDR